jgi:putative effector of murein hydrolase LrgA (UPF0299 family)
VVLCVVWRCPGDSRRRDCAIAVSAVVMVNDLVGCGVNIGRQFPLTANIRAMVVVFVVVDLRVLTVVDVKKGFSSRFLFQLQS